METKTHRNDQIAKLHARGWTLKQIGNHFEISQQMVCKILHPEKRAARDTLRRAVKSGRVLRPENCSKCGSNEGGIQAHHEDYARPLSVEWLCRGCHEQIPVVHLPYNKAHKPNLELRTA